MKYKFAIKYISNTNDYNCTEERQNKYTKAAEVVSKTVAPLCKTDTEFSEAYGGYGLSNYLAEQVGWRGDETPEEIAKEWDTLNKKKR